MKKIFSIIYVSSAMQAFSLEEATELVTKKREHCISKSVSGLLIYGSGNMLRYIEGTKENVLEVFQKERVDNCQFDILKLYEDTISMSFFEDYPLGICILKNKELRPLDNFHKSEQKDYLNECINTDELAMKVIKNFIKNNV